MKTAFDGPAMGDCNRSIIAFVPLGSQQFGFGLLLGSVVSPASAAVTNSVRLVLPSPSSAVVRNIGGLFARQILQRCEARVVAAGDAPLTTWRPEGNVMQ